MNINIYTPESYESKTLLNEYEPKIMYSESDGDVKNILINDIVDILQKNVDVEKSKIRKELDTLSNMLFHNHDKEELEKSINTISLYIDDYITDYLDPVYQISYGKYRIKIDFHKGYSKEYTIQTDACGYPKRNTGIKDMSTEEYILDYKESIGISRNIYRIYNFKYREYIREKFLSKAPKGRERAIEHNIRMDLGENPFSDIDESTRNMLKKEIEDNMEDIEKGE